MENKEIIYLGIRKMSLENKNKNSTQNEHIVAFLKKKNTMKVSKQLYSFYTHFDK